jgi:hypothetical protein
VAAAAAAESRRSAADTGQSAWATLARVQEALVEGLRGDYPAAAAQVRRAQEQPELGLDHYALAGWQRDLGLAALAPWATWPKPPAGPAVCPRCEI